jgi:hypothetical protein
MRSLDKSSKTVILLSFILTFGIASLNTSGHFNLVHSQGNDTEMEDESSNDQLIADIELSDQDDGTRFSDTPGISNKEFQIDQKESPPLTDSQAKLPPIKHQQQLPSSPPLTESDANLPPVKFKDLHRGQAYVTVFTKFVDTGPGPDFKICLYSNIHSSPGPGGVFDNEVAADPFCAPMSESGVRYTVVEGFINGYMEDRYSSLSSFKLSNLDSCKGNINEGEERMCNVILQYVPPRTPS